MKNDNRFNLEEQLGSPRGFHLTKLQTLSYTVYNNSLYVWGLKVSSRVMDERCTELGLDVGGITFYNNLPLYAKYIQEISPRVDNIFFLVRNGEEKVVTGILEVSNFKTSVIIHNSGNSIWKPGRTIETYTEKLRSYLKHVYIEVKDNREFDGHHGCYHESLYYLSKLLDKSKISLLDIDHSDFKMTYDILLAKNYSSDYHYRPNIHTNKFGYDIVRSVIKENINTEWGQFWHSILQSEFSFYKLLKKRYTTLDKSKYENLTIK